MTTVQRLLLVLILLAAGGAVAALLLGGDEPGDGPRAVGDGRPDRGVPRSGGAAPRADLDGEGTAARLSATGEPVGAFELRVIDVRGRHLPARVRLSGPDGLQVEAQGSQTWSDLPVGEWTVEAEVDQLLPHRQTLAVSAAKTTRLVVTLRDVITIHGRITDRFGEPWEGMPVWFLRPRQAHPVDRQAARKLVASVCDHHGEFETDVSRPGKYRLSIGQPGEPLAAMDELVDLYSGGPTQVRVVLGGSTHLEVELEDPPSTLAEGRADLQVSVLVRAIERDGPRRTRRPLVVKGAGGRARARSAEGELELLGGDPIRPPRGEREGRGGDPGETTTPDPVTEDPGDPVPGDDPQDWAERPPVRVPANGRLVLSDLPAERELALVLHRRKDSFRSQAFRLVPDRALILRFPVPARRSADEIELQPRGDLAAFLTLEPLPRDAPRPGFTWE